MRNLKIGPLVALVVLIWITSGFFIYYTFSYQERGSIGDMFGAINALFSGLALAGVTYAILLQQQELSLQREDLRLTRQELQRAATAHEKSEKHSEQKTTVMPYTAQLNALAALIQVTGYQLNPENGFVSTAIHSERRMLLQEQLAKYSQEVEKLLHRFAEEKTAVFSKQVID